MLLMIRKISTASGSIPLPPCISSTTYMFLVLGTGGHIRLGQSSVPALCVTTLGETPQEVRRVFMEAIPATGRVGNNLITVHGKKGL